MIPGEILYADEPVRLNEGREVTRLTVLNAADRPVQVGSHYHFAEANPGLDFDRAAARGLRLNIAAGTAVRFEPGIPVDVELVPLGGAPCRPGPARGDRRCRSMAEISAVPRTRTCSGRPPATGSGSPTPTCSSRSRRTARGGPGRAGDEAVFGGGKVIRESMGQSRTTRAEGAPDTVVTGAVIIDHWGIVKADIGIRDGRITGIGKAGNPDTMDGVHPDLVIGPETEVIAGNGKIVTAGRDRRPCPLHLADHRRPGARPPASPRSSAAAPDRPRAPRRPPSLPAPGTSPGCSRRWRPSPSTSACSARATPSSREAMHSQLRGGALGFKIHEDWGATPAVIDACLSVCEETGAQLAIHTDTLNEAGFVGDTLAAIAGRTIHAYHTEGAGGGHAPDIITVVSEPYVLPSSTNPTRPHTVNTVEEHLDMLMVCHHLNPAVPEDLAFAESRIRPSTIAAEDVLHDLGAISIISSDSQAMGRVGEVVLRTWQTAHVMKRRRGALPGDGRADNRRVRRYVAKYTINPARRPGPRPRDRLGRDRASSPTWCCGNRRSSASSRSWSSRAARSRTRRWATPTPPSPRRSRSCRGRCSARSGGLRPRARSTSSPRRRSRTVCPNASGSARIASSGWPTAPRRAGTRTSTTW